ncbi:type IV pilus biogenesis/stability protein PilW [Aliikangiella sp. G2MR2-5]|uniref:type IV pilus biogenesis/stability protein PilW n=1 Tax=Aliikangiella sp. G2MR2-5 TaxID=2788943 RepID=UPI0018AB9554
MTRILAIILLVVAVSACETTRKTTTNNIGAATSKPLESKFNKKRAAENRVNMGLTYLNRANYQRAKFHLDKAMEFNPDSANVHYAFGIYFQRVKEYKKAKSHFDEAIDINSKEPRYYNAYGAFLCEIGEYQKADNMFHSAIDIPTYSEVGMALYNVGFCSLKQGDKEKAESYFRKALNRDRSLSGALLEMAKIEFEKERYNRVMMYVKRYEDGNLISPESAWLALRASHYLRDKDSIARYGTILEQKFPDSEQTASYLDDKKRWM